MDEREPGRADQEILERYSDRLHAAVERTPLSRFRATLPSALEQHREEVVGLLDLCLDDSQTARRAPEPRERSDAAPPAGFSSPR